MSGAEGERLLLGTRAGMSVDEVLAAVPGSVIYEMPTGYVGSEPVRLVGHNDIEVAGVDAAVRFGFLAGGLAEVVIEIRHDSTHAEAVFAIKQLVVLLGEEFGRASKFLDDSAGQSAASSDAARTINVAWSTRVEVELSVTVNDGRARGTITASTSPANR